MKMLSLGRITGAGFYFYRKYSSRYKLTVMTNVNFTLVNDTAGTNIGCNIPNNIGKQSSQNSECFGLSGSFYPAQKICQTESFIVLSIGEIKTIGLLRIMASRQ